MCVSSASDPPTIRRQERHNEHGDGATITHNTLSADTTHVQVFYPFHPLYGYSLRVLRWPKRGDGAVLVLDSTGKRLKIPVWMTQPGSADSKLGEQAHLSKESLLNLTLLFKQWSAWETAITFCHRLSTDAREVIMLQLQLLSLNRTEEELVLVEATARAELIDLMARILVTVFQTEPRRANESTSIQSQD